MVVKNARGAVFLKRVIRVLGIFLIFGLAAGAMWFVQSGKWKTTTLKEVYIEKPEGDTLWVINGQERTEYKVKGAVKEKTYEGIADLEVRGKCVRKIVCKPDKAKGVEQKEEMPETIRVLLTTTDFAEKEHDEVKVRSEKPFVVKAGESEKRCEGGEELCIRAVDMSAETITIHSAEEAKLEITSIKRGERIPSYRGTLELKKNGKKIRIINELPLEQYLYGVLPSEMPAEYPEAALRAQAVCARSYAEKQKQNNRLQEYDAQVDDSVAYQVYQSQPEDERANKAVDDTKDQSYFLHRLNQEQLSRTIFPLGEIRKTEVRKIAEKIGLPNARKKDSTGICFIGERPFRAFLNRYLSYEPGPIKTPDGQVIGQHVGLSFYTIGQRKGIGIGGMKSFRKPDGTSDAWYVARKDIPNNTLYVVQGHDHPWLLSPSLEAGQPSWISGDSPEDGELSVKTRYRQKDIPCLLTVKDASAFSASFVEPQWAITPGQSAVFYKGEVCLGGGIIDNASSVA